MSVVVAVDGPAGSGKSSVSRAAASRLGFEFLDTGAAYRALAWRALERGVDVSDATAIIALIDDLGYRTLPSPSGMTVKVGDTDVTDAIREPRVTAVVSDVARIPGVRVKLNDLFRATIAAARQATGREAGIVVEGRDITTVVVPDAEVRILLTADEDVRIARRARELSACEASTAAQLRERDQKDAATVDFMTAAPGVTTLDSTDLDFDQTVAAVLDLVEAAR
jgi:cytidylate kinase